jgi:peroxiredoxin
MWFSYSMYGEREDRPRVGDRFPEFNLPASDGSRYAFAAADRKRRLLIFYRGSVTFPQYGAGELRNAAERSWSAASRSSR